MEPTDSEGLVMLALLALSPLCLMGGVLAFRKACLPRGEGSLLSAAAAGLLGVACGLLIVWWQSGEAEILKMLPVHDLSNTIVFGPLREEFLKTVALVLLVFARRIPDARHGMWLGAATGLGFAALENHYAFLATDGFESFVRLVGLRTLLCVIHGLTTGLCGAALGHGVATRQWKPLAGAFALALVLHASWNAAQEVPLEVPVFVAVLFFGRHLRGAAVLDLWSLLLGVPLLIAIVLVVRFARSRRDPS